MDGADVLVPRDAADLAEIVSAAAAEGRRLNLRGGGSKAQVGAPVHDAAEVDLGAFRGPLDYDPSELVLTAPPATPLAEVEARVAAERQMLAFEPFDHGPLFGGAGGAATLGGLVAAGAAGSWRRGRRARPPAGLQGGVRTGRALRRRSQGGQERHRL